MARSSDRVPDFTLADGALHALEGGAPRGVHSGADRKVHNVPRTTPRGVLDAEEEAEGVRLTRQGGGSEVPSRRRAG